MEHLDIFQELIRQAPAAGVMAVFAWLLLSLVRQTLLSYQTIIASSLKDISTKLDNIDERTKRCPKIQGD